MNDIIFYYSEEYFFIKNTKSSDIVWMHLIYDKLNKEIYIPTKRHAYLVHIILYYNQEKKNSATI